MRLSFTLLLFINLTQSIASFADGELNDYYKALKANPTADPKSIKNPALENNRQTVNENVQKAHEANVENAKKDSALTDQDLERDDDIRPPLLKPMPPAKTGSKPEPMAGKKSGPEPHPTEAPTNLKDDTPDEIDFGPAGK